MEGPFPHSSPPSASRAEEISTLFSICEDNGTYFIMLIQFIIIADIEKAAEISSKITIGGVLVVRSSHITLPPNHPLSFYRKVLMSTLQ
jgi:hypothetical protein